MDTQGKQEDVPAATSPIDCGVGWLPTGHHIPIVTMTAHVDTNQKGLYIRRQFEPSPWKRS